MLIIIFYLELIMYSCNTCYHDPAEVGGILLHNIKQTVKRWQKKDLGNWSEVICRLFIWQRTRLYFKKVSMSTAFAIPHEQHTLCAAVFGSQMNNTYCIEIPYQKLGLYWNWLIFKNNLTVLLAYLTFRASCLTYRQH